MKTASSIRKFLFTILCVFSAAALSAQTKRPVVTGINAFQAEDGKISISWILPRNNADSVSSFLIYRSKKPFTSYGQIEFAEPLASVEKSTDTYTDSPRDTSEYFYAVITMTAENAGAQKNSGLYYDEQTDGKKKLQTETPLRLVLPGVNATTEGIKPVAPIYRGQPSIKKAEPKKKEYEDKMREIPLPLIDVLGKTEKPGEQKISRESRKRVQPLLKSKRIQPEVLPVYIFDEDLISPSGGDEYLLFEILRTSFVKKKYSDSIDALKKFLAQNRSKNVTDRASFYLGESYYYTGDFPSALTYFLSLEETYPELSKKWSESTLDNFSLEIE
ncbi:hypothetical protein [Treponema sp.]|uniref:tetratricopeptide repeat protein n=1 Tax=Treponema sp. TaxID=166 RepID=UPI003EFFBCD4